MSGATAATAGTGEPRESLNARHKHQRWWVVVGPVYFLPQAF